jgi:glycosyltransferase involved in cell wall biosynthesis
MGHRVAGAAATADLEARGLLRFLGHRPHDEALALLQEAAVLLLVIPREGGAGNHTGKLFNYLASGRSILALAPEPNVAAALIRESRSGIVVPPDEPEAIAAALVRLHAEWREGGGSRQDRECVLRYEAGRQARDWAALLDELTARPSRISTRRREATASE